MPCLSLKDTECYFCKKKGHIILDCKARIKQKEQWESPEKTITKATVKAQAKHLFHMQNIHSFDTEYLEITTNIVINSLAYEMEVDSAFTIQHYTTIHNIQVHFIGEKQPKYILQ